MNRTPIKSSNLLSVGYDASQKILEVEFKGNKKSGSKLYRYKNVPEWVYQELIDPESLLYEGSKGTFFSEVVKGQYKYQEVKEDNEIPPIAA